MPDAAPFTALGLVGAALFLLFAYGLPYLRARQEARDKIDEERRARADKIDQERRDRADQERRDKEALLLRHLQDAAVASQKRLDEQTGEFLKALERRDRQMEDVATALRGLTTAVDSLQRRQQR